MAIYHMSVKSVSRSTGRSAVAASAYRTGSDLVNERDGLRHDYSLRSGVASSFIVVPSGSEWALDRSSLWNAAERSEKRKDAKVAREYEMALPWELGAVEREGLARAFAEAVVARYGVAADVAIHAPGKEGDRRNWHAHVLTTTRAAGPEGLGAKTRELDVAATAGPAVEGLRVLWEGLVNQALERGRAEARVDRRSLARQGVEAEPTVHLGPLATAIERRAARQAERPPDAGVAVNRAPEAAEAGRWGGPLPTQPETQLAVQRLPVESGGGWWVVRRLPTPPAVTERGRHNQEVAERNRGLALGRQAMEQGRAALEAARRSAETMRERGALLAGRIGRAAAEARARLQAERERHARAFLALPVWERGLRVMDWFQRWAAAERRPGLEGLGRRHAHEPGVHEALAEGYRRAEKPGEARAGPAIAAAERLDVVLEARIRLAAVAEAEREGQPADTRKTWAVIGAHASDPRVKDAYAAFEQARAGDPPGYGPEARQAAAELVRIGMRYAGIREQTRGRGPVQGSEHSPGRKREQGFEPEM